MTLAGYGTYIYWAQWDPLHRTLQDKTGSSVVLHTVSRILRPTPAKFSWNRSTLAFVSLGGGSGPRFAVCFRARLLDLRLVLNVLCLPLKTA